jgi:hypothetical protein
MGALRLIVEESIKEARSLLEPDFSMRSSSLNMIPQDLTHNTFESIPGMTHIMSERDGGMCNDFEDIGNFHEEQKSITFNQPLSATSSHSVAIGGDDMFEEQKPIIIEASTDVDNLIN